jgi:hypothetical protein
MACAIFAAGIIYTTWIFSHYAHGAHPWQFIPGFLIGGIGLSLIMIPIFSAALQDVDVKHAGSASGILNAVQQVGAAIGIAVIGVIFFGQLAHGSYQSFDKVSTTLRKDLTALHVPSEAQDAIATQTRDCFHDRSSQKDSNDVPASCQQAEASAPSDAAGKAIGRAIQQSAINANAYNFASAFRSSVIYMLLLLVVISGLSLTLPRKLRLSEDMH